MYENGELEVFFFNQAGAITCICMNRVQPTYEKNISKSTDTF